MSAKQNKHAKFPPGPDDVPLLLEATLLKDQSRIIHAFSTRKGGYSPAPYDSFNLSAKTGDKKINVRKNIERLKEFLAIGTPLYFLNQVHGKAILVVDDIKSGAALGSYDAVVTSREETAIVILTADCLSILLYDPVKSVISAVHAGWKGTTLQIAEKTVEKMKERFGSDPAHIIAVMGPAIGSCCYEVDHPVMNAFKSINSYTPQMRDSFLLPVKGANDKWMLDLVQANRLQLLSAGLIKDNIDAFGYCTSCRSDLFYSHRRDGKRAGRQGALIMIKTAG